MPYNVPAYSTDNFSFGPGILYAGAAGTTPTTDIGAVRSGAELAITRERITVEQGSPFQKVAEYVIRETATLTVTGIEWNFDNLARALGAGVTTSSATKDTFAFGGDMSIKEVALKFVHRSPAGHTFSLYIWKANGTGELTITFGDDIHEFPYTFEALRSKTDWAGGSLPEKEQLFKIIREK